jgi:hypothetical protein
LFFDRWFTRVILFCCRFYRFSHACNNLIKLSVKFSQEYLITCFQLVRQWRLFKLLIICIFVLFFLLFKPLLPLHRQLLSVFIDLGLVCRLLLFSRQIPDSLFISTLRSINKICWFLKPRPRSLRRFFELINHIKLLLQFFLLLNSFFSLFKKKHALFIDLWRLLLGSLFFFAKLSFSEFFFCCF